MAENWQELVVYGGIGRAARNWESFDAILRCLQNLEEDETLMVQSGKPVGIFKSHIDAPKVLIANSNLVGDWATWEHFRELEKKGLMMYGQMTAGSWIYIGTQGILQGTYETLASLAKRHFDGSLKGTITLTGGLGGMGGAQPLAVTMNEGVAICVEVEEARIDRRIKEKYLNVKAENIEHAIELAEDARERAVPLSIGLLGNCAEILPRLLELNFKPDVVTDQTSAHDMLHGYVPDRMSFSEAQSLRQDSPDDYIQKSKQTVVKHVEAMLEFQRRGSITFDYGNNIRGEAQAQGVENAFDIPGFVPEYIRPLFCEGSGTLSMGSSIR